MREQDRKLFNVAGVIFFITSFSVIVFPYWIVFFVVTIISALSIPPLGIWTGFKDKSLPMLRRVWYIALGAAYIIGAAIMSGRIWANIEYYGWFARFR